MAKDEILKTPTMRIVSSSYFGVFSQFSSYGLLWLAFGEWLFALVLWIGVRIFALWVNMLQNFWTHDRRFGTRRYPGRRRQRNEHHRLASRRRNIQRVSAKQSSSFAKFPAKQPRRIRIRFRLSNRPRNEISRTRRSIFVRHQKCRKMFRSEKSGFDL